MQLRKLILIGMMVSLLLFPLFENALKLKFEALC